MTQITSLHNRHHQVLRRPGLDRAFEAQYCGSANVTDHKQSVEQFLTSVPCQGAAAKHVDQPKPRMWQDSKSGLWMCQIETIRGTGTTQDYAYTQMWALLKITHPHFKKPDEQK